MIGFLGCLCFLECHCLLFAFKVSACSKCHVNSQGYHKPTYLVLVVTRIPCICFESYWTPTHCVFSGILCSWEHHKCYLWRQKQRTADMHTVCTSSAHAHVLLFHWPSLIKQMFKDRIIRNFKKATTRALNQKRGPSEDRTLCECKGWTTMKLAMMW